MSPEETMHERIVSERARRVAIQQEIARKIDERIRQIDPAFRPCTHEEYVRDLVVDLGEIGALYDRSPLVVQDAVIALCALGQSWAEQIARDLAQ